MWVVPGARHASTCSCLSTEKPSHKSLFLLSTYLDRTSYIAFIDHQAFSSSLVNCQNDAYLKMSTDETYADAAKAAPATDNVIVDGPEGSDAAAAPAEKEHPYTIKTLKEHNKRGDLWMLLHGKVYDVTKFMDEVCCFPFSGRG